MERTKRDSLLGLVFFGTLGGLLWATVNLTDLAFGNVPPLQVHFPDLGGIRAGDPVQLLGMKVGKVDRMDYEVGRADGNRMRLTLRLEQPVPLTAEYRIEIQPSGVLGGKQVYIDPGRGNALDAGVELLGRATGDVMKQAGDFFEGSGPTGAELKAAITEINRFFHSLNDPQTSIGAVVNSRELYEQILGSVQSLRRSLLAVERGDGAIGRLVHDRVVGDDLARLAANLRLLSERLTGTEGTLPKLLNDPQLAATVAKIADDLGVMVGAARDGRGLLGAALVDSQVEGQFKQAIADLAAALRKVNDPEAGILGRAFADPELGRLFQGIVADVAHVTHQLAEGKGVFGVLINDEDLGVRLRRIFHQVSRAIEDAREAAPIATFVQVLVGVF